MNSRKSATAMATTLSRFLKSESMLKSIPPAFYPLLSHPTTSGSTIKSTPARPSSDTPPSTHPTTIATATTPRRHTRRRPPLPSNSKKSIPLPIVFPEDKIRSQFFRDHPFEAFRPIILAEGLSLTQVPEPSGERWTELRQRSLNPTAEDAISFTTSLHAHHDIPLTTAYNLAITQFRSLRAEHETANRSASLQATAHGATFFGEISKGILLEEKVLDGWIDAREINARIQAAQAERGGSGGMMNVASSSSTTVAPVLEEDEAVGQGVEYTGGIGFVRRFQDRSQGIPVEPVEESELAEAEQATTV